MEPDWFESSCRGKLIQVQNVNQPNPTATDAAVWEAPISEQRFGPSTGHDHRSELQSSASSCASSSSLGSLSSRQPHTTNRQTRKSTFQNKSFSRVFQNRLEL